MTVFISKLSVFFTCMIYREQRPVSPHRQRRLTDLPMPPVLDEPFNEPDDDQSTSDPSTPIDKKQPKRPRYAVLT